MGLIEIISTLLKVRKAKKYAAIEEVKNCTTCTFNIVNSSKCTVGTYYAERGLSRVCYEGELWKSKTKTTCCYL